MQIELKNKKETKTLKIDENTTVEDVLKLEEIPIETVVIKVNGQTVTEDEILNDSDVMEVIKVIYGG
ncbi:MoaD/ThiS family protein [Methanosphaera cuniculi]|uniref:MoaD/ThiS family protein n=1 Tax=Methanosphaera cuniculi TaxID=1077256 RepID=UPI0026EA27CA|nr:MoaD/ThiS family protein [Methanosphaera cuniculi]